jgi:hypothetical protein
MISRKMAGTTRYIIRKKTSTADVATPLIISERGGKKKTRYYSIWFWAWFFVEDYWFDVCFRFLTIETWVFYVLRIPNALAAFRIISVCLIYCDTLTHDSGCLSVISTRLSNRTSPLFLVYLLAKLERENQQRDRISLRLALRLMEKLDIYALRETASGQTD